MRTFLQKAHWGELAPASFSVRGRPARRGGFTLLEMILSLSIGLILLGALYFLLTSQVEYTQKGRDVLDEGTVARTILTRLGSDIQQTLGPLDLRVVPDYATTDADQTDPLAAAGTDMPEGTEAMPAETPPSSSEPADPDAPAPPPSNTLFFNVGVQGEEEYLILTVGKVVRLGSGGTSETAGLRRIMYWMVKGEKSGLARKEIKNVTGEERKEMPSAVADPEKYIIAPEVKTIRFEYFDGNGGWPTSWDGGTPVLVGDLEMPLGPPSAIRVTLTIRRRGSAGPDGEEKTVNFEHVIALPTGNHFPQGGP